MIVHKFGGTSVGSPEQISMVADIIIQHSQEHREDTNPGTVVIVSAMSGVTDQLIRGADGRSCCPWR